jgi:two-component system LytT family response regulator
MKVLVVDDERLAREELKRLLSAYAEVEVVGDAANGKAALAAIEALKPDAVFLDIQMPGLNGLDVAAAMEPPLPWIVFVTAYDKYAIQAFEMNAVDYIVKPADPARVATSVQRLKERASGPRAEPINSKQRLAESDRVFVRDGEKCWFVPINDFKLLESEGNYTKVHFADGAALIYRSLTELETRLPERIFFRINRGQIINTERIEKVEPWFSGSLKARLQGGAEVEFSRRAATLFRERMSL